MKKCIALILAMTMLMSSASVFAKEINLPKYEELDFEEALEIVYNALEDVEKEKELFGWTSNYNKLSLAVHIVNVSTSKGFNSQGNETTVKSLLDNIKKHVPERAIDPISEAYQLLGNAHNPVNPQHPAHIKWTENELRDMQDFIEDESKKTSLSNFNLASSEKRAEDITFSDVNKDDWYYETVMEMTSMGLFNGKTEPVDGVGTFAPDDTITGPEFIAVLCRMIFSGVTPREKKEWYAVNPKTNEKVKSEAPWYGDYNTVLEENEILSHSESLAEFFEMNNTITYQRPITREQMATLVVRALHVSEMWKDTLYEDVKQPPEQFMHDFDKCSEYYAKNVNIAYHAGIMTGDDNGNINPSDTATRAEAAAVLYRLYNLLKSNDN